MILQMTAKIYLEQITKVSNVISSACAHFGKPSIELVKAIDPDHVVDVTEFFEVFTKSVHGFGQICRLIFDLSSGFYDLLVEDLIRVSKVSHACAEDHGVLVHVDRDIAFFGDELWHGLAILGLFKDFVGFLEFL